MYTTSLSNVLRLTQDDRATKEHLYCSKVNLTVFTYRTVPKDLSTTIRYIAIYQRSLHITFSEQPQFDMTSRQKSP